MQAQRGWGWWSYAIISNHSSNSLNANRPILGITLGKYSMKFMILNFLSIMKRNYNNVIDAIFIIFKMYSNCWTLARFILANQAQGNSSCWIRKDITNIPNMWTRSSLFIILTLIYAMQIPWKVQLTFGFVEVSFHLSVRHPSLMRRLILEIVAFE